MATKEKTVEELPEELPRSGSINEPPGSNVLGKQAPDRPEGGGAPVLTSISPASAAIGGADVTMECSGSNFLPGSIITFNGGDEPTTIVSPTKVTTIVKPSTATTPGTYPVTVKHSGGESAPQGFTFTAAGTRAAADPDDLEEELEEAVDDDEATVKHGRSAKKKK